jgi:hypothetical protein
MRYKMSRVGIILSSHIGLGNRLFQVAFIHSYAKKHNKEYGYTENHLNPHSKINYLESVYPFLKQVELKSPMNYIEEETKCISYVDIPNYDQDVLFQGYFQCDKYFREYKKEIQNLFTFPKINHSPPENSIFLHVRRGDYIYSPNHYIDLKLYYIKCLQYLKSQKGDFVLYVVSDDIAYCKKELSKVFGLLVQNIIYVEGMNELETMNLMRSCKLGGICANSSFSWWGGYLNPNEEKMVFFPSQWFRNPKYQEWTNEIAFEGSYVVDMKTYEIKRV